MEWFIVPDHSVLPFLGQQECGHALLLVSYLVKEPLLPLGKGKSIMEMVGPLKIGWRAWDKRKSLKKCGHLLTETVLLTPLVVQ